MCLLATETGEFNGLAHEERLCLLGVVGEAEDIFKEQFDILGNTLYTISFLTKS